MENLPQNIGIILRKIRKYNRLSIAELSALTDISPKTISFIERGETPNPGYYTVCKLLGAMKEELYVGVPVSRIIYDLD